MLKVSSRVACCRLAKGRWEEAISLLGVFVIVSSSLKSVIVVRMPLNAIRDNLCVTLKIIVGLEFIGKRRVVCAS